MNVGGSRPRVAEEERHLSFWRCFTWSEVVEICRFESNAPLSGALKGASNGNTLVSDATCGKHLKVRLDIVIRTIDQRCDPAFKQLLTEMSIVRILSIEFTGRSV